MNHDVQGGQGGAPWHNQLYSFQRRQGVDKAPNVATGMFEVSFDLDVYVWEGSNVPISFIIHFIASSLYVCSELLCEPFRVYPISESIAAKKVHRNCFVFILH